MWRVLYGDFAAPDEVFKYAFDLMEQAKEVIADDPAGLAELTWARLMVCDVALIPCSPSALDLEASRMTVEGVNQARRVRKDADHFPRALFLPNRLQTTTLPARICADRPAGTDWPVCSFATV
jgi:chromosome partitioning protein